MADKADILLQLYLDVLWTVFHLAVAGAGVILSILLC